MFAWDPETGTLEFQFDKGVDVRFFGTKVSVACKTCLPYCQAVPMLLNYACPVPTAMCVLLKHVCTREGRPAGTAHGLGQYNRRVCFSLRAHICAVPSM